MKIACITDDGTTISQHFGRAEYFKIFTVEDIKIVSQEIAPKIGHKHFNEGGEEHHHENHGSDAASHEKHFQMADAIMGCEALICGGMGLGAYQSMNRLGIKPIVTEITKIEEAIQQYIDGTIIDHTEKLH